MKSKILLTILSIATLVCAVFGLAACTGNNEKSSAATVLSVTDASIDGTKIFMLVEPETENVPLSDKIVCNEGSSWKLYFDILGQVEIPTKIAAQPYGELNGGDNIFYIVVTSPNGAQLNTYELTVHRSYQVPISYYDGEILLRTESAYTGRTFTASYLPDIKGYSFNGWTDSNGTAFTSKVLWDSCSLYVDKAARTYIATLDVNGGVNLPEDKQTTTVIYDQNFNFPIPSHEGYFTFTGWYIDDTQLTDAEGKSISVWNIANDSTITAHWEVNKYNLSLEVNDSAAGTVQGNGTYAYGSEVTITATTNDGYNFLGWYDKDGELISTEEHYIFSMGLDTTYTAKWNYYTVTILCNDVFAGTFNQYYDQTKVSAGTEVTLTVKTNEGYTWLGWYDGDTKLTTEFSYSFIMEKKNVSFEARWIVCPVTVQSNNDSAGTVDGFPSTTVIDDIITVNAVNYLGFDFLGWYVGEDKLSGEKELSFNLTEQTITYMAKYEVSSQMEQFIFTSTTIACNISGVKNKEVTSIVVPDYVTQIRLGAFSDCKNLESITVPFIGTTKDEAGYFDSIFGTSSHNDSKSFIPTTLKEVIITGGNTIRDRAFWYCRGLTSITLPRSLISIGEWAFYECRELTSITIPSSVTTIGQYAFSFCTGLETAIFENPSGWKAGNTIYTREELSNASLAASYLWTSPYRWERT